MKFSIRPRNGIKMGGMQSIMCVYYYDITEYNKFKKVQ